VSVVATNRKQRRMGLGKRDPSTGPQLVPVVSAADGEFLEWADVLRVRILLRAANVGKVIRSHRDGRVVAVQMRALSNDLSLNPRHGNPRRHSHDHEVDQPGWTGNPNNVWTLKPKQNIDRGVFTAVLDSCMAA
jgi:hypothetical protein